MAWMGIHVQVKCPNCNGEIASVDKYFEQEKEKDPSIGWTSARLESLKCRGFHAEFKKGNRTIAGKCQTKPEERKTWYSCDPGGSYSYCNVYFCCQEKDCRVAFCKPCMRDYYKYGSTVTGNHDEAYRIWYNKNKYRKLDLLKPLKFESLRAPEYWGNGKSHATWLAEKAKLARTKKEAGGEAAGADADAEAGKPKKSFIHNVTFNEWELKKQEDVQMMKRRHSAQVQKKEEDLKARREQSQQKYDQWLAKKEKLREEKESLKASLPKKPDIDLKREPQIPQEWLDKYDRKMRIKRQKRIREQMQKKKAEQEEKKKREESEQGFQAWAQRKEMQRMKERLDADSNSAFTMHTKSNSYGGTLRNISRSVNFQRQRRPQSAVKPKLNVSKAELGGAFQSQRHQTVSNGMDDFGTGQSKNNTVLIS